MGEKVPENISAKMLLAAAQALFADRAYIKLHGFGEIRVLLQMADIQLRLPDG